MKKNFLKTLNTVAVVAIVSFSTMIYAADEISLPVISKPTVLQEGTQRELSAAQIADLLPWAKDSKVFLLDLLENIQELSTQDKIDKLVDGIKSVVGESAPKNSEMLMRYSLNRGLVVNSILSAEIEADVIGSQDVKLRVLVSSIQMAIKNYDADMLTLSKKGPTSFVLYGLDYFSFLTELNKSIFDASAQYQIQKTALEWLQWDLYRDLNNTSYASQIVKINNSLKSIPNKKLSDAQYISNIRLMKKTIQQLTVSETYNRLVKEQRNAEIEAEKERTGNYRSDAEAENVNLNIRRLKLNSSGDTFTRRDAVVALRNVVGGDVTIALFEQLTIEVYDNVKTVLINGLNDRLGVESYVQKNERLSDVNIKVLERAKSVKDAFLHIRVDVYSILSNIKTKECYQLLSTMELTEEHENGIAAIRASKEAIEAELKKK